MQQKVVSIRMSVANNTVVGPVERDFIVHTELNKMLDEGWKVKECYQATGGHNSAYTALTFLLEKESEEV